MRILPLITVLILLASQPLEASEANTVILLSWDGMRHDFPDRGNYPALKRLETEGIRAGRLTPVALSNTFPGHVSLATGTTPEKHGIVDNVFYDRKLGTYAYSSDANWIRAEPLWIAAERQGVKAATYFWVGSETDWQGQRSSYRMAPFDGGRAEADKVDKIIEWLDLPAAERPRLIMSYWRGADSVAHMKGPDHPDVAAVIQTQDVQLGRLLTALDERELWPTTTLMIVSDHGMTEVTESVSVKEALADAGLNVRVTGGSSANHLFLESETDRDAVLELLRQQPHIEVFTRENAPKGTAAPGRTGDFIITTQPPHTLSAPDTLLSKAIVLAGPMFGWKHGAHGFDPEMPDMGGIFYAIGRGVDANKRLHDVHQLDIAPTVTQLLGIEKPLHAIRQGIALH